MRHSTGISLADGLDRPQHHVLEGAEVKDGLSLELDPDALGHRVLEDRGACRLQRPRRMMDLAALHGAVLGERVEAVALGEPVLERARPGRELPAGRLVAWRLRK